MLAATQKYSIYNIIADTPWIYDVFLWTTQISCFYYIDDTLNKLIYISMLNNLIYQHYNILAIAPILAIYKMR